MKQKTEMPTTRFWVKFDNTILKGLSKENASTTYIKLSEHFAPRVPTSDRENKTMLTVLNRTLAYIADSESELPPEALQSLRRYVKTLSVLILSYESGKFDHLTKNVSGSDVLEFLMEQHGLNQSDLKKELGSQSVVSEILAGKRTLNARQIKKLIERFHVSPSAFF